MMALPPLLAGTVQLTVAEALPATALPIVGAPGTVAGVTGGGDDSAAGRCRSHWWRSR